MSRGERSERNIGQPLEMAVTGPGGNVGAPYEHPAGEAGHEAVDAMPGVWACGQELEQKICK